jgi:hypothetical protein
MSRTPNQLVVLETRTRKVRSRFGAKRCERPMGIAFDPASRQGPGGVRRECDAIVSRPDGRRIAELPIGKGANGATFDLGAMTLGSGEWPDALRRIKKERRRSFERRRPVLGQ